MILKDLNITSPCQTSITCKNCYVKENYTEVTIIKKKCSNLKSLMLQSRTQLRTKQDFQKKVKSSRNSG